MFQKVLLAVDGSDHSAKAVPVAADIARKSKGEVLVIHGDAAESLHRRRRTLSDRRVSNLRHIRRVRDK